VNNKVEQGNNAAVKAITLRCAWATAPRSPKRPSA
jgi:hypothetical protein